ncbi:MAG: hypothetical protein LQ337_001373 [Flavoplaca oasis]|nr:MAG: hypothetical protein LQ337_001373 [Flavoplaca oasis]
MFDGYSIASASQPHRVDGSYYAVMDDDISPTSSPTTTPFPEEANISPPSSSSMDSVMDLSYRLEQHTLEAHRQRMNALVAPDLSPSSLDIEPPILSSLHTRPRRSSSLLVLQQQQATTRRQCITPARQSHISALVEETSHDTSHPSSICRTPVSPTPSPSSFTSPDSTPSSSGSEDCGSETSPRIPSRILASKVTKEWRRSTSSESLEMKQKLVLRNIRMRRSLMRMRREE